MRRDFTPYVFMAARLALVGFCGLICVLSDHALRPSDQKKIQKFWGISMGRQEAAHGKVLYLGDSVNWFVGKDEPETVKLSTMVGNRVRTDVVEVSRGAHAIDTFSATLRYLKRQGLQPVLTIVPINLRSFGPVWELNPGWSQRVRIEMLDRPIQARALSVFKWSFGLSFRRFLAQLSALAGDGIPKKSTEEILRAWILREYAFDFDQSHRPQELRSLIDFVTHAHVPVCFYITPINIDLIRQTLRPDEVARVDTNLAETRSILEESAACWRDWSDALLPEDFVHEAHRPNEHLSLSGRRKMSKAIGQWINRHL